MTARSPQRGQAFGVHAVRGVAPQIVEETVLLDVQPLAERHVDADIVPPGLWDRLLSRRLQHNGRVQVDEQHTSRTLGRAEHRHDPVDVLRGSPHEVHAPRGLEGSDEPALEIGLRLRTLHGARPPDGGALHHEDIDVLGWRLDDALHQPRLAPVRAEVARVVHAATVRLDQQRVRVESTVIDQIGRDPERSQRKRLAVAIEARVLEPVPVRNVPARGLENVVRRLAQVHRHIGPNVSGQPVVVLVGCEITTPSRLSSRSRNPGTSGNSSAWSSPASSGSPTSSAMRLPCASSSMQVPPISRVPR